MGAPLAHPAAPAYDGTLHIKECSMSFFGKILDKLGFDAGNKKVEEMLNTPVPPRADAPLVAPATNVAGAGAAPVVDIVAILDKKAAANSQKLNWKTSIVDLLKLLDLDSSLASRKELANELNIHAGADGSAEQNMALHKAVLARVAANGGNVPKELL
jgi:hypothetical protein